MAARASFSSDSRIVKMPPALLPNSILLKDHLLDDLSSCSSNGFRSYPRTPCCTKVRYLIEIDLNKHLKLPPSQNKLFKNKSKSKKLNSSSSSILHKASNAVVHVFNKFQFSASRKPKKAKAGILPRNLSRKLSRHGLWKKPSDGHNKKFERLNSFEESIKQKKHISPRASKVSVIAEIKTFMSNDNSNSNSFVSSDSYFTATSDSSTVDGSSKINAAHDVEESEKPTTLVKMNVANGQNVAVTDTTIGNAQKEQPSMEKDQFSPVSVLDFPFDNEDDDKYDEDEVTSPFRRSKLYVKGSKQKRLVVKVQRTKSTLAQLKPVRLEDRIALSESRLTHDSISELSSQSKSDQCELEEYETEKKAIALLQLLKATMPSHDHVFESTTMTESILLGFFAQRLMEGNVSNYTILQEAKDWINDQTKDMFETQDYKLAYITDMEKGAKWFKYDEDVEREDISFELEYQVFTSLVEEMLRDFYL